MTSPTSSIVKDYSKNCVNSHIDKFTNEKLKENMHKSVDYAANNAKNYGDKSIDNTADKARQYAKDTFGNSADYAERSYNSDSSGWICRVL